MYIKKFYLIAMVLALITSCTPDEDFYTLSGNQSNLKEQLISIYGDLNKLTLPNAKDYTKIPSDPKNKLTEPKVLLGSLLFHETGLAHNPNKEVGKGTYSCASCHHAEAGFQSGLKQGIGEGGSGFGISGELRTMSMEYAIEEIDIQPIRSPTVLNTAYQDVMLWNGQFGGTKTNVGTEANWITGTPKEINNLGYEGVETQAIAGIGVHRLKCDKTILEEMGYKAYFDNAFPEIDESERYSKLYAGLAIAAYERSVLPSEAPFQKWLKGDETALNEIEKKGAALFFGKANCYACHSGPALSSTTFHALGMKDFTKEDTHSEADLATKKGRGGFTLNPEDDYKFKTATIYNLKDVTFLGHGGSFTSIKEIIQYKNDAVTENAIVPESQISSLFTPLNLSEDEVKQLTAFVENGLYDDNLGRFVPDTLPSKNCFPVADPQSKLDMNCGE